MRYIAIVALMILSAWLWVEGHQTPAKWFAAFAVLIFFCGETDGK